MKTGTVDSLFLIQNDHFFNGQNSRDLFMKVILLELRPKVNTSAVVVEKLTKPTVCCPAVYESRDTKQKMKFISKFSWVINQLTPILKKCPELS